ncbi:MAG: tRNA pseudouridine(38-40) synthase TruA [bacterium]
MLSGSRKVKLVVSYEGTAFHGYQKQPDGLRTVQSELERSLEEFLGEKIEVFGASRTDAGVHAIGQVVHFTTEKQVPPEKVAPALRRYLPPDIAATSSELADENFHARHSARGKYYMYVINRSPSPSLFLRNTATCVQGTLDISKMARALEPLVGEHDFAAFMNKGTYTSTTVRNMFSLEVAEKGSFLVFTLHGSGFLYKMVRNIVGTALEAGRGRMAPEATRDILESGDRGRAGPTAPPNGLYLVKVEY